MRLKEIDVLQPFPGTWPEQWGVRAIFTVEGFEQDFGCAWGFNDEGAARDFADDTDIVLAAGQMAWEAFSAQSS